MYDDLLVVRNHGKSSAKRLLGTSTTIEKVGLFSYFLFVARTTVRIRLNTLMFSWFSSDPSWHLVGSKFL